MQKEQPSYSRELERPAALSKHKHTTVAPQEAADADAKLAASYGGPVCGVDEAGRGSWAGPIVAAAVVLPVGLYIPKLTDSKVLSRETRDDLCKAIHEAALGIGVAQVSAEDIDRRGLTWANTHIFEQAAIECVEDMRRRNPGALPGVYYLDQIQGPTPDLQPYVMTPKADSRSHAVAAASIIAKTFRDDIMRRLALQHPEYSFDAHKGYINSTHIEAVQKHGRLQGIHRFSYNVQVGDAPADPFARWRPKQT